tara:strand:+ start:134 stop:829 length:696 start_codon:yes stop_codon:yes gene_type:complete
LIKNKKILGIIPARGGSKGLLHKNILPFKGKPLIAWTIKQAQESQYIDRLIVSTDDNKIAEISKKYGASVPFIRPAELSNDKANLNDVILHSLNNIKDSYDIIIVLQPTSPLRKTEDIDSGLDFMAYKKALSVVSICKSHKPIEWNYHLKKDGIINPVLLQKTQGKNRQQFEKTYTPNGALFMINVEYFKKVNSFYTELTYGYKMPPERSIDIDTELDFFIANAMIDLTKN